MEKKKKATKSAKNKEKILENQIENAEKGIEILEKIAKEEKEKKKEEEKRKKAVKEKISTIREDLKNQLITQNKFGKQFDDMIEDYIFFINLKEELQADIEIKGIRYRSMTGNGYPTDKPNESVQNLIKVNAQMLKILQDLELKAPEEGPEVGDGKDDLLS